MIWISKEVLSESPIFYLVDDFFTLKPFPVCDYCPLLPKFEQKFDRIQIQCVKNLRLRCLTRY